MSASARSSSRCYPYFFQGDFFLFFPLAAVADEGFPCLGCSASTAAAPALVISLLSKPFQIHTYWRMPGFQSEESGYQ